MHLFPTVSYKIKHQPTTYDHLLATKTSQRNTSVNIHSKILIMEQ